jgi:putative tRNA adenosine deaminase-associated protein
MAAQAEVIEGVDFALAVYREEGVWQVEDLAHDRLVDVETLAAALRRFPGDGGAVGLIGMDEDFFVVCRVVGATVQVLLSDVTAAEDWELAESVMDHLGLPDPEDEEEVAPAGDLAIFADAGFSAIDMGMLLDDDLYPDEALSEVADRIGFGDLFDEAVGIRAD